MNLGIPTNAEDDWKLVQKWMYNDKDGRWCANNMQCIHAVQRAFNNSYADEIPRYNEWLKTAVGAPEARNTQIMHSIINRINNSSSGNQQRWYDGLPLIMII